MRNRLLTVCAGFLLLLCHPTNDEGMKTEKGKRNVKSCKCNVTVGGDGRKSGTYTLYPLKDNPKLPLYDGYISTRSAEAGERKNVNEWKITGKLSCN